MNKTTTGVVNKQVFGVFIFLFVIAMGMGLLYRQIQHPRHQADKIITATMLPTAQSITDFNLIDSQGNTFTQENLKNHWTFMFFGYSHCPQQCPVIMAQLNDVYNRLAKQESDPMPQVMLMSIDPKHDTPARLKRYVTSFNPAFKGATGDAEQIKRLTHELSIAYSAVDDPNGQHQLIEHSGTILLFNPQGKLAAFFAMPYRADSIAQDFATIRALSRKRLS